MWEGTAIPGGRGIKVVERGKVMERGRRWREEKG